MKKIRTFGFVALTAASIAVAGAGLAVAAPPLTGSGTGSIETFKPPYTGSANPGTVGAPLTGSGTGSAEGSGAAIDAFLKALLAGSSSAK